MTRSPEVDAWLAHCALPQATLMEEVRAVILACDPRLTECIKWQAPTFTYKGNMATFMPRARKYVGLMFHSGASIPGTFSLLKGDGTSARVLSVNDSTDLRAKSPEIALIVRSWCDLRDLA